MGYSAHFDSRSDDTEVNELSGASAPLPLTLLRPEPRDYKSM